MSLLLVIDTETCGIPNDRLPDDHPAQPPLVQLGAILVDEDNGAEWATLEVVVRPNGWVIPSKAAEVHGISTAVAEIVGVPLSCVVPMYVHLRSRAARIVAFNKEFDLKIMRQAIARNGKAVTLLGTGDVECAMELASPIMKLPPTDRMIAAGRGGQFKNPSLVEAHRYFFGEDYDGAHSALADARATARVYFACKRIAAAGGVEFVTTKCPRCEIDVVSKWVKGGGCFSDPSYVLVADLVFHGPCWDAQVEEHPTDGGTS